MATTAAAVKQPTGTAIRTMMQLAPATGYPGRLIQWGCSFDASALATPGQVEVVDTGTVFATVSTAYATTDIQLYGDSNTTYANTAGTSGVPFNLGTSLSGFATAAGTEGSTTATRYADLVMIDPAATFATTVNMYCYCVIEF
jgi:hypothetical protein